MNETILIDTTKNKVCLGLINTIYLYKEFILFGWSWIVKRRLSNNYYCMLNAKEFWNELRFKSDSFNIKEVIIVLFILVEYLHFECENKIILFNN